MDEGDIAQEYQSRHNQDAIRAALPIKVERPSRTSCLDCECDIPELRRIAVPGCERCVRCEAENETLRRR